LSPLRLPISPPGHGREEQYYGTDFSLFWLAVRKLASWCVVGGYEVGWATGVQCWTVLDDACLLYRRERGGLERLPLGAGMI
jgi:hypothetical protein